MKKEMGKPMVANLATITRSTFNSTTETGKEAKFEVGQEEIKGNI